MANESKITEASSTRRAEEIEEKASRPQRSLPWELADFLLHNKKWWLTPIIVVLLLVGMLAILASTGRRTSLYTLF